MPFGVFLFEYLHQSNIVLHISFETYGKIANIKKYFDVDKGNSCNLKTLTELIFGAKKSL